MVYWNEDFIDYRVNYESLSKNGVIPEIKSLIAHSKRRFQQRFHEEYEGSYRNDYRVFSGLVNKGLCEHDIYLYVDWFYGYIADRTVHSTTLMMRLVDKFYKFIDTHSRLKSADEDWFKYCINLKEESLLRNQSNTDFDSILLGLATELPKRKIEVTF